MNDNQPNDDQPFDGNSAGLKAWQTPILRSISLRQTEGGARISPSETGSGYYGPS